MMDFSASLRASIESLGLIPVVIIDDPDHAVPMADALAEGGLPIAEITFRTPVAAQAIKILRTQRPGFLTGAGTVLDLTTVTQCRQTGAAFALSPGLDLEIVNAATEGGLPFVPGIMTPTDLTHAVKAGLRLFKFFPASAAGGPKALAAIAAPFQHLGVRFIPTGGISLKTLEDWLALPVVSAVGGSWIATPEDLRAGRFSEITAKAKAARAVVEEARSRHHSKASASN